MIRVSISVLCTLLLLTASARLTLGQQSSDPKKTLDVLTGDAKGAASNNPQCKLFTQAEAAKYIGKPVGPGQNAAGGAGCQWVTADDTGDMIVTVVGSNYHEPPKAAPGYKALADVGKQGFVAPDFGGWAAGAVVGDKAIRVSVEGPAASEAMVIALLKETIKRRGQ